MGLLTSLAAAKYLFSGNGGGGHRTYRPPTPEELEEHRRFVEESNRQFDAMVDYFWNTNIGHIIDYSCDTLKYIVFGTPGWLWFVFLGGIIVPIIISLIREHKYGSTSDWGILICIASLFLILLGIDTAIMLIRFVVWLFSPA